MSEMLTRPDDWEKPVTIPPLDDVDRLLVPFDGSHTAECALAWAALVAGATGAEVLVVAAYEPPLTKKGRGVLYVEDMQVALADEARELAEEAVTLLLARGCRARGIIVRGEPGAAILDTAEDEEVDLIILGRRGLSAELRGISGSVERFHAALRGGVAEKVVRNAESAVMVVG